MIRPLFKAVEPFMHDPSGNGYVGVIMYDDKEDKMQCHECGKYYSALFAHISAAHKEPPDRYRIRHELPMGIGLCSKGISKQRRIRAYAQIAEKSVFGRNAGHFSDVSRAKRKFKRANKMKFVARDNRHGLCTEQMKARYAIVKNLVGRHPSLDELKKYDARLAAAMRRKHGGVMNFRKIHGIPQIMNGARTSDLTIAAFLRKQSFSLRRAPRPKDVRAGSEVSRDTIYSHFGSWRAALIFAGLKP